jgi:SpoIIAA-like
MLEDAMIEPLQDFPDNVLAFQCRGHVTRDDYERVLIPAVESALRARDKVRLYYQIGADFEGIDPAAVWEDFKVGMGHLSRWERIAVVTDVAWIGHTMRVFGFLIPAEIRVFALSEATEARDWIQTA